MKKKTIILIILVMLISLFAMPAKSIGLSQEQRDQFKGVTGANMNNNFGNLANVIFTLVQIAGGSIAAIYVTVLGIRYMISSVEDRADIKKKLIPFTIGVALFFGVSFFVHILADIASNIK